jgi:hypothetical protein
MSHATSHAHSPCASAHPTGKLYSTHCFVGGLNYERIRWLVGWLFGALHLMDFDRHVDSAFATFKCMQAIYISIALEAIITYLESSNTEKGMRLSQNPPIKGLFCFSAANAFLVCLPGLQSQMHRTHSDGPCQCANRGNAFVYSTGVAGLCALVHDIREW